MPFNRAQFVNFFNINNKKKWNEDNLKAKKYIHPYLGGTFLGLVLFLSFFLTGDGLGASGAINRFQVAVLSVFASDHVNCNGYMAEMGGGNKNALDSGSVVMLIGTFLGGLLSGLYHRRLKIEIRKGPQISNTKRLVLAFVGGAIMGYGARMARGCTSGQALSGGAVLSLGSWLFMFCVFGGAYLFAYSLRKIWN